MSSDDRAGEIERMTGVVRGEAGWSSDDPRIWVNQYKPENPGDPDLITFGMYLGKHHWTLGDFTPEAALRFSELIRAKPAVRRILEEAL